MEISREVWRGVLGWRAGRPRTAGAWAARNMVACLDWEGEKQQKSFSLKAAERLHESVYIKPSDVSLRDAILTPRLSGVFFPVCAVQ